MPEPAAPGRGESAIDRLVAAMTGVTAGLSLHDLLRHLVESAARLVDARYGAIGVIGDDGRLQEFVTFGAGPDMLEAIGHYPEGLGILGVLIVEPEPLRLRDLSTHPRSHGFPPGHPPMRSFLGVPIRIRDVVFGNFYFCEKQGADEFSEEDEALTISLASLAAVAIENARLHEHLRAAAVFQDRERIARDLHDKVIQRLFAAGMSLQASSRLVDAEAGTRIADVVDQLDLTIADIRGTIFALESRTADGSHLSTRLVDLVDEMVRPSAIDPTVRIDGALNTLATEDLADDALTVVREALANVAKHARARTVDVHVTAGRELVITVVDDGIGLPPDAASTGGHGLLNLERRAQARGGVFTVGAASPVGTIVEWRVPMIH